MNLRNDNSELIANFGVALFGVLHPSPSDENRQDDDNRSGATDRAGATIRANGGERRLSCVIVSILRRDDGKGLATRNGFIDRLGVGEPRCVVAGEGIEEIRFADLGAVNVGEDRKIDEKGAEGHVVNSDISGLRFKLSGQILDHGIIQRRVLICQEGFPHVAAEFEVVALTITSSWYEGRLGSRWR